MKYALIETKLGWVPIGIEDGAICAATLPTSREEAQAALASWDADEPASKPEAAPLIDAAMIYMREHMDEMRALNPPNGWGDADGALRFLGKIREETLKHPKAVVGVH